MTTQSNHIQTSDSARKTVLNQRLEDVGWGVLLVTVGSIWLVPEKQIPPGSWLIAAGLIMVGLNVIRYFNGIAMSGFSLVVGILALFAGAGAFFHWNVPLFGIALIVIGICMLLKPVLEKGSIHAENQDRNCVRHS